MKIPRRPAVSAIRGTFEADLVTQPELKELGDHQAAEWLAAKKTHRLALIIEDRLHHGAGIEAGGLTFDRRLGMTRSAATEKREKTG